MLKGRVQTLKSHHDHSQSFKTFAHGVFLDFLPSFLEERGIRTILKHRLWLAGECVETNMFNVKQTRTYFGYRADASTTPTYAVLHLPYHCDAPPHDINCEAVPHCLPISFRILPPFS
jgi:hypothetical protein